VNRAGFFFDSEDVLGGFGILVRGFREAAISGRLESSTVTSSV